MGKLWSNMRKCARKNRFIQGRVDYPIREGRVNLERWLPPEPGLNNLGDELSSVIVQWMMGRRQLDWDSPARRTCVLSAVGSILGGSLNDLTVWGTGLLVPHPPRLMRPIFTHMDVRALRGPLTESVLSTRGYRVSGLYGDPAVLMPLIYQPKRLDHRVEPLLLSHMRDSDLFDGRALSMMTTDYKAIIDAVCASPLVITTSLHGIILAEAYGVPAVLMRSTREDFSLFKYEDWYRSTGRLDFPVAETVVEAASMTPAPLPQLGSMRNRILETFPYDLWDA